MRAGPALLYLAGVFLLSVMNLIMKHLIGHHPVITANAWRYVFAALAAALLWQVAGRPPIARAGLPLHAARGLLIAASAFGFFWALTRLTLVETVALYFVSPLLVPPLARLLLKEPLEPGAVAAGLLGFAGVLVAAATGPLAFTPERLAGVASVLAAALAYALATILVRARAPLDGAPVVSLLGALVPALLLLPLAFVVAPGAAVPEADSLPWFAAAGLCSALALWLFARALEQAEPQAIAPFEYSSLAWLALFGWLLFEEPVRLPTLAGALLIVAACLYQKRRSRPPLPAV